jgi:hypothetical protein
MLDSKKLNQFEQEIEPIPDLEDVTGITRGFWFFSSIYGVSTLFFFANFYSLGFSWSYFSILFLLFLTAPFLGALHIFLEAYLFQFAAFLFGTPCSIVTLRSTVALSKIPYLISLGMWLMLLAQDPDTAFLQISSDFSAGLIPIVSIFVYFISFITLVQSLRKIQSFSASLAIFANLAISLFLFLLSYSILFIYRFISIFAF